ncbi:MAG: hypothetical protein AB7V47_09230 [Phycisphaerales bacterium]
MAEPRSGAVARPGAAVGWSDGPAAEMMGRGRIARWPAAEG